MKLRTTVKEKKKRTENASKCLSGMERERKKKKKNPYPNKGSEIPF